MRGNTSQGFVSKAGSRGLASPTRVGSGGNIKGITTKGVVTPSKTSAAGGFVASRKKGSVKGC